MQAPARYASIAKQSLKEMQRQLYDQMELDGTLDAKITEMAEQTFDAVNSLMDNLIREGRNPGEAVIEVEAALIPEFLLTKDAETIAADADGYLDPMVLVDRCNSDSVNRRDEDNQSNRHTLNRIASCSAKASAASNGVIKSRTLTEFKELVTAAVLTNLNTKSTPK